ncbi:serine incorporator/TMS membrane protein [Entophlyctis helioformis]|nr:serine incorporator/TMS membrane protein [Entophlyctis helioformis]
MSVSTRALYTLGLIVSCVLALLLKTNGAKWLPQVVTPECGPTCWNYLAVYRIAFGLVLYHGFLFVVLLGVQSSSEPRANIQNGLWPVKLMLFIAVTVGPFYMENYLFYNFWIACLVFSSVFIILQSIILIDFACTMSESWVAKYNETRSPLWQYFLVGTTALSLLSFFVASILLYVYFSDGCSLNVFFITFNIILCLAQVSISILPRIIKASSRGGGILPSAMLSFYNTYLVATASVNNPQQCGLARILASPIANTTNTTATSTVFTAVATTLSSTVATTTSTAFAPSATGIFNGTGNTTLTNVTSSGSVLSYTIPSMQATTIIQITGIAFTALMIAYMAFSTGTTDLSSAPVYGDINDESDGVVYNYSFFHLVYALTAFYMASVFTNWESLSVASESGVDLLAVNKGQGAMWITIITSWINVLLFIWTLVAPVVLRNRKFG